ncbi:MAG: hypothetical protein V4702_03145 [Patescibacteria group bacterium]
MVFLDETGKRWRKIKLGTGLLGSTAALPLVLLSVGALLYLPNWSSFNLPKTFGAGEPQIKSVQTSQPSNTSLSDRRQTSGGSSQLSNPSTPPPSEASQPSFNPLSTTGETTPNTTTTPTTTAPTKSDQGLTNQPGKSDYGRAHRPTSS